MATRGRNAADATRRAYWLAQAAPPAIPLAEPHRKACGAVHAGGGIDAIGRIVGARLSEMWG